MTSFKKEKVASLLKEVLSEEIRALRDPELSPIISIIEIKPSNDLSIMKVLVSIYGEEEEQKRSLAILKKASGQIKHQAMRKVVFKKFPEILFQLDRSIEYASKMSKLLDETRSEREDKNL